MTLKILFSDSEMESIKSDYLNGHTISDIAKKHLLSVTPIKTVLKNMGVVSRPPNITSRKYYVNENYFSLIDTEDKAYFLGLLMADGYNSETRGVVALALKREDRYIMEKFSDCICTNKPVLNTKNKDGCLVSRMEICSRIFSDDLVRYGCVQAKTFKVCFPDFLKDELLRHFIRGFFDGDGCISYCYAKRNNYFNNSFSSVVTFTSTLDFCLGLKSFLKKILNINSSLLCRKPENKNNIRTLQVSGNKQVIKFSEWIYRDTDLFLKRKYDKYQDIINIIKQRKIIISKRTN